MKKLNKISIKLLRHIYEFLQLLKITGIAVSPVTVTTRHVYEKHFFDYLEDQEEEM